MEGKEVGFGALMHRYLTVGGGVELTPYLELLLHNARFLLLCIIYQF